MRVTLSNRGEYECSMASMHAASGQAPCGKTAQHRLTCLARCGVSCCAAQQVQADDIKVYLAATLGQAPKPDWGLKNGWGQYLAGERLCIGCLVGCCLAIRRAVRALQT